MRISDWSSDVCSSDLCRRAPDRVGDMLHFRANSTQICSGINPDQGICGLAVEELFQPNALTAIADPLVACPHADGRLSHAGKVALHPCFHGRAGWTALALHRDRHAALALDVADHAAVKPAVVDVKAFEADRKSTSLNSSH